MLARRLKNCNNQIPPPCSEVPPTESAYLARGFILTKARTCSFRQKFIDRRRFYGWHCGRAAVPHSSSNLFPLPDYSINAAGIGNIDAAGDLTARVDLGD